MCLIKALKLNRGVFHFYKLCKKIKGEPSSNWFNTQQMAIANKNLNLYFAIQFEFFKIKNQLL